MSAKRVISKENKLAKNTKRVLVGLWLYEYKERLKYKCIARRVNYKEVDDSYTSKICSKCGWENERLGGNKIFNCQECKIKIDRDINGARGIFIKHYIK